MSSVFHFCLLMPGLVFSLCALNVVTDSMLTKAVSASDTGESRIPRSQGGAGPGEPQASSLESFLGSFRWSSPPISGWVCPDAVSVEWGGWPGV